MRLTLGMACPLPRNCWFREPQASTFFILRSMEMGMESADAARSLWESIIRTHPAQSTLWRRATRRWITRASLDAKTDSEFLRRVVAALPRLTSLAAQFTATRKMASPAMEQV